MAQEEHILSSTHSGSGGDGGGGGGGGGVSSDKSKSGKQKKVPQRGLGVAQLEKIRLEEQRKREALEAANVLVNNDATPCLAVQCPSFGPSLSPSPNFINPPPPSPSPSNFLSPKTSYRSASSVPSEFTNQLNVGSGDLSLQALSPGNGDWSGLWNGEHDYLGVAFRPPANLRLQFETNTIVAPFPSVPQRSSQSERPSSPLVNASSGISPSVLSSQMEPPSNQILHSNNYTPSGSEEYKIVGMKRSYPFSFESLPTRSFPSNFDPTSAASRSRSDELPSSSSGYPVRTELTNKYFRDSPANSSHMSEQNPGEVSRDYERLNGDFLKLAPPTVALPALNSKHKNPLNYSESEWPALPCFKCLPGQENIKSQIHQSRPSRSREEPFSFFPITSESDQSTAHVTNGDEENREMIDLNLKL